MQLYLELAPKFVFVGYVVVQFNKDVGYSVFCLRASLILLYLLKAPKKGLQWLCYLLFYFGRSGSGIDGGHHSLTDGEGRKFVFGHVDKCEHTETDEHHHQQEHDAVVVHHTVYDISFAFRHKSVCLYIVFVSGRVNQLTS